MKLKKLFGLREERTSVYESAFHFGRGLPAAERVLVLAAHPDDETLGCGGALALHKVAGAEVRVLVLADGAKVSYQGDGDIREIRKAEALSAGATLGIDAIDFLGMPDMELGKNAEEASSKTFGVISEYRPDLVYAPSPLDFHPDHRVASDIAMEIAGKGIRIAFYEIYAPMRFNLLVDITEVLPLKEKAMEAYSSSLLGTPAHFIRTLRGLNAYRGFLEKVSPEEKFYEAFFLMEKPWSREELVEWFTYGL